MLNSEDRHCRAQSLSRWSLRTMVFTIITITIIYYHSLLNLGISAMLEKLLFNFLYSRKISNVKVKFLIFNIKEGDDLLGATKHKN